MSQKPLTRDDVTEQIVLNRVTKGLKWADIAKELGVSKEWCTSALLGQSTFSKEHAEKVGHLLDLSETAVLLLQQIPSRGILHSSNPIPTDPVVYRLYEMIKVHGTAMKALVEEEFGDGISSAIDFKYKVERESDPKGDRVNITLSGKFLPFTKPY